MDALKDVVLNNLKSIAVSVCVIGSSVVLWRKFGSGKKKRVCGVDYPKDVVIVHQFQKGPFAPSLGHFVMKLETYLRINKIPFEPAYGSDMGPKHKCPWIEYNGTTMGDSQMIINFLNKEFKVDMNKSLNPEQRAVAWAIQKWLEEFTYHLNVYTRWNLLSDEMATEIFSVSRYFLYSVKKRVEKSQYIIGTARHSREEVHEMVVYDLQQLSNILGNKTYIMGGAEPTEVDCAAFGILSQIRWQTPSSCPGRRIFTEKLTNLMDYTDRLKQQYWPDWDDRIAPKSSNTL